MLGVGVPNGLSNLQSKIAGVKTHLLEEFFISCHLDVTPVESCKIYYKGEGGGFPQV
jgi:hypothetical protein